MENRIYKSQRATYLQSATIAVGIGTLIAALALGYLVGTWSRQNDVLRGLPGITLANPSISKTGVLVTSVQSESEAGSLGIEAGDLILAVDQAKIDTPIQVNQLVENSNRSKLILTVRHGEQTKNIALHRQAQTRQ